MMSDSTLQAVAPSHKNPKVFGESLAAATAIRITTINRDTAVTITITIITHVTHK